MCHARLLGARGPLGHGLQGRVDRQPVGASLGERRHMRRQLHGAGGGGTGRRERFRVLRAASKRASTHEKYKVGVRGEHHHRPDVTRILSCTLEFVSTPRNDSYIDMHVRKFCMQTIGRPRIRDPGWLATLSLSTRGTRLGSSPSRPATIPPSLHQLAILSVRHRILISVPFYLLLLLSLLLNPSSACSRVFFFLLLEPFFGVFSRLVSRLCVSLITVWGGGCA